MLGQLESQRSRLSWNKNEETSAQQMWGGTGVLIQGKTIQRIQKFEENKSNLARWSSCTLRGKEGAVVRIVSIYVPNEKSTGPASVATQHRRYYDKKSIPGECNKIWWKDFKQALDKWYQNGENIIVAGDVNEEVQSESIQAIFNEYEMRECLTERHDETPETCKQNNKNKTIDGIWATPGIQPTACGYLEYGNWDHRPIWIDLDEREVFGHREIKTKPMTARKLKLQNTKAAKRYCRLLKEQYEKKISKRDYSKLRKKLKKIRTTKTFCIH